MSDERIDVLGMLTDAANEHWIPIDEILRARAAVAELIEAAESLVEAETSADGAMMTHIERVEAALTRVRSS